MFARTAISRNTTRCLRSANSRGLASAAIQNPWHYETSDSQGVKVATRDDGGPTANLAIVVKAGSRYEPAPGLAHALANFAFKNTTTRSALRLQRESELLGSFLSSSVSRENVVLRAKFMRQDLPYFLEAFADVLKNTKYQYYESIEEVLPAINAQIKQYTTNSAQQALEAAHVAAFHRGLGEGQFAVIKKYISHSSVADYAKQAYNKSNIAIVGSGLQHGEVAKWTGEFFKDLSAGPALTSPATKYFGGEQRIEKDAPASFVIGFPGSAAGTQFKPEFKVLAHLLGGKPQVKWNQGASFISKAIAPLEGVNAEANHLSYSDAGLLYVTVGGPESQLGKAGSAVVEAIKAAGSATPEQVKAAINQAKFDVLAKAEDKSLGLEDVGQSVIHNGKAPQYNDAVKALEGVSQKTVQEAVKKLLDGKASIGAIGDLKVLPFGSEMGLNV
ncbi:LuxS/MPP-like metallohydrolase [Ascobolus immersus RN42]|uniref:Cytochrome b-c1 complex subunit 2, mitochondrial n=1 Tax=Ascobolus immersus RN42 TaxID=1160509 RepID=A0A3N4I5B3_ASCIM|nr:LuxS/MPP-like metallohydrolase [Ascobolus immersus RN42]